jgi:hypothetical protein
VPNTNTIERREQRQRAADPDAQAHKDGLDLFRKVGQ